MDTPNPVDVHVGSRLRLRRSLMGLSQEKLGELLGLTFQQVQKYERGSNRIGSSRLFELGRVLDVPITYFFEELVTDADGNPVAHAPEHDAPAPVMGLAEERAAPFEHNGVERPDMHEDGKVGPLIDRRETLELVRAFNRIGDPLVRRRVFELTKALANMHFRAEEDAPPSA